MKNKKIACIALTMVGLMIMTGCNVNNLVDTGSDVDLPTVVTSISGINVKRMSSGTDTNGFAYQEYSYSVFPETASNLGMSASVTFADSRTDGGNYLGVTVNTTNKTFRITCYAAFNSVATVRLQAIAGDAYADVQVDYRQKLATSTFDTNFTVGTTGTTALYWHNFSTGHVTLTGGSVYTIPETFTYMGLKSAVVKVSGGSKSFVTGITQDLNYEAAVTDICDAFGVAIETWLSYSIYGSQATQEEQDLYYHVGEVMYGLSDYEKGVLATAESGGLIKVGFTCSTIEHYYSTSIENFKSFTSTENRLNFNIPSSIYSTYGVSRNIKSVTTETTNVYF